MQEIPFLPEKKQLVRACGESKERKVSGSCWLAAGLLGWTEHAAPAGKLIERARIIRGTSAPPGRWKRIGQHGHLAIFPGENAAGRGVARGASEVCPRKRGRSHEGEGWSVYIGTTVVEG
jgi:hypothetical protein